METWRTSAPHFRNLQSEHKQVSLHDQPAPDNPAVGLKITERTHHNIAILTCNIFHGIATHYTSNVLPMCHVNTHSDLPLPIILLFHLSMHQLSASGHFWSPPSAKTCTVLPDNVVSASSVDSFRNKLKTFIGSSNHSAINSLVDLQAVLITQTISKHLENG